MSDPIASHVTEAAARSTSALRMVKHRDRRRKGLRCVTIELRENEIDTLIRRGQLARESRENKAAIKQALYAFFDDQLR